MAEPPVAGRGDEQPGPPPLPPSALRWRCATERLEFDTTAGVEPITAIVGQDTALDALRFGLEARARGQNIFVRGLTGTGRSTMVRRLLEELRPARLEARDFAYVHNFVNPDQPLLITLAGGQARRFRRAIDELVGFIRDELKEALSSEGVRARKAAIDQASNEEVRAMVEPFERALHEAGLALVTFQVGPVTHSMIFPLVDDQPVAPEKLEAMHEQGEISDEAYGAFRERRDEFQSQLEEINHKTVDIRRRHGRAVKELVEGHARAVLNEVVGAIARDFPNERIKAFLEGLIEDTIEKLHDLGEEFDFTRQYRVNVLHEHEEERAPVVIETAPTLTNLLGIVDRETGPMGMVHSDHMMIHGGSLLRADGGFLILEARDVLTEPGAWKVLVRTLRTGRLEIVPPELSMPWFGQSLKPEAIDIDVKVILLGDSQIYYLLDAFDSDFPYLFKVLADFDDTVPRDDDGIQQYVGVLSRIASEEKLRPFDRSAVARLVEHGARIAARRDKLTTRFGRLVDLAREAAFLAGKADRDVVVDDDVREAIRRTKRRADLPSRRFRELLADGTIRVATQGRAVGQVNGLAVIQAGPLIYGFPARITSTIGPGSAGVINIEREAALSGAIHTKGFYILGGLLRHLLQTEHPLTFVASVAFEQSYGGIDGDSASGAEICCLLSALTGLGVRQDLAMTGAIDQVGNVLPVGAVNEKIEGFHDTCLDVGLTGTQGVIIPAANAGDLMLREDVVEACADGRFHVYATETVQDALSLLTGVPAGERDARGQYAEGTVLARAVEQARRYWLQAARPQRRRADDGDDGADDSE
ncbi:MAG: Lon protease family protein [Planctomycetota bacterium]|jgi:ATP-dependent Lon protease